MNARVGGALRAASVALETGIFVAFPLIVFAGVSRLGARTTALLLFAVLLPGAVRAAARVERRADGRLNWIVGAGAGRASALIARLHERGQAGPLWEKLVA